MHARRGYPHGMGPILSLLLPAALAGGIPAVSGVISVKARDPVGPGSSPAVLLEASDREVAWAVECTTGEEVVKTSTAAIGAGVVHTIPLPRNEKVTTATCAVLGTFANGLAERRLASLSWTFVVDEDEKEAARPPSPSP